MPSRSPRALLAVLLLLTLGNVGTGRAACVGDCDADGRVGVGEIVTGVGISLGDHPLSQCPALDANQDGSLRIDELVTAVNAALIGCPATPTPQATDTPAASPTVTEIPSETPTPLPTDTPTETPTVPAVAGHWREEPLAVTESTCPTLLTESFAEDLASRPPCAQTVESTGELTITLEDCTGTRVDGTLERNGTIHVAYPTTTDDVDGCIVALTVSAAIPAAVDPTTASYTFAVAFSGECSLSDCAIHATGAWTRLP